MKSEYDFSKGERGKFYRPDVELNIPVYLDSDVAHAVRQYAKKGKSDIGALVNEWLRRNIKSMDSQKPTQRDRLGEVPEDLPGSTLERGRRERKH